jgi:hypothetical protein
VNGFILELLVNRIITDQIFLSNPLEETMFNLFPSPDIFANSWPNPESFCKSDPIRIAK